MLAQVHTCQSSLAAREDDGALVSRDSLRTDLANAHGQIDRMAARMRQLEKTLSQILGDSAWRESGIEIPGNIDVLKRRITGLGQANIHLKGQLEDRPEEFGDARAANRELMVRSNAPTSRP